MQILFSNYDADVDVLGSLKDILNKYYISGIDRIISYGKSSNNNIVGEFVADGSQFYFSINPEKGTVSYSPVGIKKVTDSDFVDEENRKRLLLINPSIDSSYLDKPGFVEGYLDSLFETNFDAAKMPKSGAKTVANKAGKTLTCTPGKTYPCGAVCKALGKPCKGLPMPEETKKIAETIAEKLPTTKKKATKPKNVKNEKNDIKLSSDNNAIANALDANKQQLKSAREQLIKDHGDILVKNAEESLQKLFKTPNVYVAVSGEEVLDSILDTGLKNSFEVEGNRKKNAGYVTKRILREKEAMGISETATAKDRPIYGYFGTDDIRADSHAGASVYGDIKIRLKPSIKSRSTFSGVDSFLSSHASPIISGDGNTPPPYAESFLNPSHTKAKRNDELNRITKAKTIDDIVDTYAEVQIRGSVKPEDIDSVYFTDDKPSDDIIKKLRNKGIKIFLGNDEIS